MSDDAKPQLYYTCDTCRITCCPGHGSGGWCPNYTDRAPAYPAKGA
jgi:hypothetical protein